MTIKDVLRKAFRSIGLDIRRFDPTASTLSETLMRRKKLLDTYAIDVVLDVGANSGQFGKELRQDLAFSGHIVSFEPLGSAFEALKKNAEGDVNWQLFNYALGDEEARAELNIAGNSYSSSILEMLPSHIAAAPDSKYVDRESIEIKTLDSIIGEVCPLQRNIYLKIDTQGAESKVLNGAENALVRIDTIQLEMSLIPLYRHQLLFDGMHDRLVRKGYTLVSLEPEFWDPNTGQLLQVDGIYHRF